MFITINGQLGSGKSEVCRILREEYGFELFHTGRIQREYAAELGISTLELNELCKTDYKYDRIIDGRLKEYSEAMRGKNVVFDSRMAWHFVEDALKVHLLVNPRVAAERVYGGRVAKEEKYASVEEAMNALLERRRLENDRYNALYNVRMFDYRNYDLVLDTSETTVAEEVEMILDKAKRYFDGDKAPETYLAPSVLKGTRKALESGVGGVGVVKADDVLYVASGAQLVEEAKRQGRPLIAATLLYEDEEVIPELGITAEAYVAKYAIVKNGR